ncbi:MAG: alcohol dehydrogenase catalytic domain-containing protein [Acidimicrobiia bacterium]|nr:alcohol dehydrogenase catalytic domain-containing protein [Acidimicrobiia bacterium]NNL27016.1 alcohol dehydrogenase catalytic domain-containing protein [Acidimicrobiia bacterium]
MKAARFYGAKDIRVEEIDPPGEPGPGEVLIAPSWCGICGTDLHEYIAGPIVTPAHPHPLTAARLPQVLGHEYSGTVVAVGPDVTHVKEGDRIAGMPLISCMHCYHCVRGDQHLCQTMACTGLSYQWGALADLAMVPGYQLSVLPDDLTMQQGALLEPAAVAVYAVERGRVHAGDTVLIAGLGPIGALAAMAARALGAGQVLAVEPNENRASRAGHFGVDKVLAADDGLTESILKLTGGIGADATIECSGTEAGLNVCVDAVRAKGVVVQAGLHTGRASVDPMAWCLKDLTIEATWAYPTHVWPRVARLVATGRLPVERVVTSEIGVDDVVKDGFDRLVDPNGTETKVLVSPIVS